MRLKQPIVICSTLALIALCIGETTSKEQSNRAEVSGSFTVKMQPQSGDEVDTGRMIINKTYAGGLIGVGSGQLLSKRTGVKGSAGYVAIEHVQGELNGKTGSFTLLHYGIMDRGEQFLKVEIVPDSGTGELSGISGTMSIQNLEGKKVYTLTYNIAQ